MSGSAASMSVRALAMMALLGQCGAQTITKAPAFSLEMARQGGELGCQLCCGLQFIPFTLQRFIFLVFVVVIVVDVVWVVVVVVIVDFVVTIAIVVTVFIYLYIFVSI